MSGYPVIPLITVYNGEYSVNDEALGFITSHTRNFGVISCAGKYRTGKSFMLNQLTDNSPGFGVGESVQACTKGLWLCKNFFRVNDDLDVLYIDTEGIDALDASDSGDVRIFTLALMLSSAFMYNSTGHIDEASLSTLGLMTRVTDGIKTSSSDVDIKKHMPSFHWVLRDFSLKLEDKEGNTLTNNEYLEHALAPTQSEKGRDATRNAVRDFFSTRQLHTLPRPTRESVQNMNEKRHLISSKFHEGITELRDALYKELAPMKTEHGVPISGLMYAELCRHLAAQGESQFPVLRDTWALMATCRNRELKDKFTKEFADEVNQWSADELTALRRKSEEAQKNILAAFEAEVTAPLETAVMDTFVEEVHRLAEARVVAIGVDIKSIIATNMDALNRQVQGNPTLSPDAIDRAMTSFCTEYPLHAAAWKAAAFEHTTRLWLPLLLRLLEDSENKLSTAESAKDLVEREIRTELVQATADKEAAQNSLEDERGAHAQTREDMASVRVQNAGLQAAIAELQAKIEADSERALSTESTPRPEYVTEVESKLSGALTTSAEASVKADEANARAAHAEAELAVARETISSHESREAQLTASWEAGLARVRQDAEAAIATMETRCIDAERTQRATHEELNRTKETVKRLEQAADSVRENAARETRQLTDLADKNREMCENSQSRLVEVHKSMVDDLRSRDEKVREMQMEFATERATLQSRVDTLKRENETKTTDLAVGKRRIEELEAIDAEAKRMRVDHQALQAQKIRDEETKASLTARVSALTSERDSLRQTNLKMDNELAVLRAEKKLRDTSESFAEGNRVNVR